VSANHTENVSHVKQIQAEGIQVKLFTFSQELTTWLKSLDRTSNVRVISNQIREEDGGEAAGERLCRFLKGSDHQFKSIPFLLFCKNTANVPITPSAKKENLAYGKLE